MEITEESQSVLLVLHGTGRPLASHALFLRLPRVLRTRWSEPYLVNVVLPDLMRLHLIEQQTCEAKLCYSLTVKGKRAALTD